MRILRATDVIILSPFFTAADGESPADCDSTPTCTVTREDGTALTGAAVLPALALIPGAGPGQYIAVLTAADHTALLDRLTLGWSGLAAGLALNFSQGVEVVGAHHVSLAELRRDPELSDAAKHPTWLMQEVRDEVADYCDRIAGVAFAPRYERDLLDGTGKNTVLLSNIHPRSIRAVTIDGVVATVGQFTAFPSGLLAWNSGTFAAPRATRRNVAVTYEHGLDAPPTKLTREVRKVIRTELLSRLSGLPQNTLSQTTADGMTIRYGSPDASRGRPTGTMGLDAVLMQYSERVPGVA